MTSGPENPDQLAAAVERYGQLERLRTHLAAAGELTARHFPLPIARSKALLDESVADPVVSAALTAELDAVQRDESSIIFLQSEGLVDEATIHETEMALQARRDTPLHRLAQEYAGKLGTAAGAEPTEPAVVSTKRRRVAKHTIGYRTVRAIRAEAAADDERAAALAFLAQDVTTVAERLDGMELQLGDDGKPVTIIRTRAQDAAFNKKNVETRPIFRESRRDVYVGYGNGHLLMFIAAGDPAVADSCVGIMGIKDADGNDFKLPSQVTIALGLTGEKVGDARLRGNMLILDLEDRKQPANG